MEKIMQIIQYVGKHGENNANITVSWEIWRK